MIRFSPLWLAIFIIFPFVWQRCNLFNLDQLISTLSPNGIILNTYQLNPPLSITETTYIGFCDAFPDSSLPIGLLWLTTLALSLISACFLTSLVDCFGDFFYFSLPIGLFRLTALAFSLILACLSCFFGWLLWGLSLFQLVYRHLRLTALALPLIPACFLASSVDCFGASADSSLLFGFFGWLLWGLFLFQLASPPLD